ncbi:acetolactate synthase, regulatory subunit [Dimargaris verticillata]|uniref:Acetolactate synthase, regulatory subunit n=1 Tax=Dimargaris verticillata TaxID=2761393 RepID=A0A9W8E6E3_9FUNG|nr:acetolactate synthase, regulatory subunit [Dimargaris verticillata]
MHRVTTGLLRARLRAGYPATPSFFCRTLATSAWQASPPPSKHGRRFPPPPPQPSVEEAVSSIVINSPDLPTQRTTRHDTPYIFNVLMQDEPGVLNRVTDIMAARGYNIDSLVVAKTHVSGLSRMTVTLLGDPTIMNQARSQLEDLVPVWAVVDYSHSKIVEREVLLCKISLLGHELVEGSDAGPPSALPGQAPSPSPTEPSTATATSTNYTQLLLSTHANLGALKELTALFQGRIVDVSAESIIVELCAKSTRINAFLKLVQPFGILEAARSGKMVMGRSAKLSMYHEEAEEHAADDSVAVDISNLPPG